MKVFICWSGELSKKLAAAIKSLIEATFRKESVQAHFSPDIEKGAFWSRELGEMLANSQAGIVCLTPENLTSPWIHYEAGLIASHIAAKSDSTRAATKATSEKNIPIYPLLHQLEPAHLTGPLAAYQATTTQESDIVRLIGAIAQQERSMADRAHEFTEKVIKKGSKERSLYEEFRDNIEPDIPLEKVIDDFSSWFRRKTFDEPVQQCMSRGWRQRYDATLETRARIQKHLPTIRAASPWHERELAELLSQALDYYADATAGLLMPSRSFPLDPGGELSIDPGVRMTCEARRLQVKALVARILNSAREKPKLKDAVRYFGAETFEERKLIVHRIEDRVRRHYFSGEDAQPDEERAEGLRFDETALRSFRGSSWELERIFYYLNVEYHPPSKVEKAECAIRDVELEMERLTAKPASDSFMAVGYALGAVRSLMRELTEKERERLGFVLNDVSGFIEADPVRRDPGQRLKQLIESIRRDISSPTAPPSPPTNGPTRPRSGVGK